MANVSIKMLENVLRHNCNTQLITALFDITTSKPIDSTSKNCHHKRYSIVIQMNFQKKKKKKAADFNHNSNQRSIWSAFQRTRDSDIISRDRCWIPDFGCICCDCVLLNVSMHLVSSSPFYRSFAGMWFIQTMTFASVLHRDSHLSLELDVVIMNATMMMMISMLCVYECVNRWFATSETQRSGDEDEEWTYRQLYIVYRLMFALTAYCI